MLLAFVSLSYVFSLLVLILIFSILWNRCLALLSALPRSSRELVLVLVLWSSLVCSISRSLVLRHFSSPSSRGRIFGALESRRLDARWSHPWRRLPSS